MSEPIEATPGMHVGYDAIHGVVYGKIIRLYCDRYGKQMMEIECSGKTRSWHGQEYGTYKKGLRDIFDAQRVAPAKNFVPRGLHMYWTPVNWKEPVDVSSSQRT